MVTPSDPEHRADAPERMPPSFAPRTGAASPSSSGTAGTSGGHGHGRRLRTHIAKVSPRTLVAVLVVTMASGFLFWASASTARGTDGGVDLNLVGLVRAQERAVGHLDEQNRALREEAQSIARSAGNAPSPPPGDVSQLSTVAVTGPGVTITLTDAPAGQVPEGARPDDLVIHQQDIEDIMNALWSGGAEAMTVQGARITSRTVVRCIGNVILVDGTSYSPPYVVSAIGDPDTLRDTVNADPRIVNYKQYVALYGLGWKMETSDKLRFDAATEDQTLDYAQVGNGNG